MSEKTLNFDNFDSEINDSDKLVLVDFFATWCGPCNMLAPVISEISDEYDDKLKVCKVNVDENQKLALKYNISSIPTILFIKGGKVIDTKVGFFSKSELENIISNLL